MDIMVRPAVRSDAAAIADIYNQAVLRSVATFDTVPETVEARERWLDEHSSPRHPVLVAEADGRVVGWASLSSWSNRCAYETTVEISTYIDEGWRGKGLGPMLSRAVLEAGAAAGVHSVLSRICTENEASLGMARSLGFREVGVLHEVGRKFDRSLDVMMLEKLL